MKGAEGKRRTKARQKRAALHEAAARNLCYVVGLYRTRVVLFCESLSAIPVELGC